MKKTLFLFCLFLSMPVVAQETITLPSTFDENQMIVKKKDANGSFMPVNQIKIDLENQPALAEEKNLQGVKLKIKENVQNTEKDIEEKTFKTFLNVDEKASEKVVEDIPVQENEQPEQKPATEKKRVRKFRAIEKDYGIPKSTFDDSTLQEAAAFSGSTFDTSTMKETVKEFKRESTIFEECDSEDPDCQTYELDEEGQVIF